VTATGSANLAAAARSRVSSLLPGASTSVSKPSATAVADNLPGTGKQASALLVNETNRNRLIGVVPFRFDPNTIKIGHMPETKAVTRALGQAGTAAAAASGEDTGQRGQTDAVVNVGDTTISFGEIVFDGPRAKTNCDLLLNWTYPYADGVADQATAYSMPLIKFVWAGFQLGFVNAPEVLVVLSKVDVDYCRFTADGFPTRAKVSLSAKIRVQEVRRQNPTSGGLPHRTGHLVTEGENLPSIAKTRYGSTADWRVVAAVNGIADPLRVRPGQRLYLPGRSEPGSGR
jgi:nucleoid-associated protein YgaU